MYKQTIILLLFCLTLGLTSVSAQNVTQQEFQGVLVPQYMGSGTSTRLPTTFFARIEGLTPGTYYKYYVRAVVSSDFGTTTTGVGNSFFHSDSSAWKYVTSPSFSAGKHDTFFANDGFIEKWFSFVYTGNTRFSAGNKVYPLLVIETLAGTEKRRLALNDSIHVLNFSTGTGANDGTGIYGRSLGVPQKYVAVYTNDGNPRPLTISHVEDDGVTIASTVGYWNSNVDQKDGAWAGIVPNDLDSGVRQIIHLEKDPNTYIYEHQNTNGLWGNTNTVNPSGGSSSPLYIDSLNAPFSDPIIGFTTNLINHNEVDSMLQIIVEKTFGSLDTTKIKIGINAGSAAYNVDYTWDSSAVFSLTLGAKTSDTFYIKVIDDGFQENTESLVLSLKILDNGKVKDGAGLISVSISDNDKATYSFNKGQQMSSETDNRALVGVYKENGHATQAQQVQVVLKSKGYLTLTPQEFTFGNNNDSTFTFGSGLLIDSQFVRVTIFDESTEDDDDTIVLALRAVSDVNIGPDSILTLIIKNDDITPVFTFEFAQRRVKERNDSFKFRVIRTKKNNKFSDVKLSFNPLLSTAANSFDFEFSPAARILSFNPSSPDTMEIAVEIKDDNKTESDEYIRFKLESLTNSSVSPISNFDVIIEDDDHPFYQIKDINSLNGNGVLDSLDAEVKVSGVVYGINMRPLGNPQGFQFTIRDQTGGLQVFSPSGNFGYTVSEGDSVTVQGVLGQFGGVAQVGFIDTVIVHHSMGILKTPKIEKTIREATENDLVKLEEVTLVDPSQWPSTPMAANTFVDLRCSTEKEEFIMRIDSDTDIDGTPVPAKYFDVTGLGSQEDFIVPLDSNYLLIPRRLTDIESRPSKLLTFDRDSQFVKEKWMDSTETITITISNITELTQVDLIKVGGNAQAVLDYQYNLPQRINFTPGDTSRSFKIKIVDNGTSQSDKVLELGFDVITYGVELGKAKHLIRIRDDETSSISELEKRAELLVYPVPASEVLNVQSKLPLEGLQLRSLDGKLVLRSDQNELNVAELSRGLYFLQIRFRTGELIQKKVVLDY